MKTHPILTITALGFLLTLARANAEFLPVCNRTPAVKINLEQQLKKTCEYITESDLLTVKRITVQGMKITHFLAGDFTGLRELEILNIRSNPYTELPEGLMKDLVKLNTIVIISTKLRQLPDDFLAYNPLIKDLHIFRTQLHSISESVFQRLQESKFLENLDLDATLQTAEKNRLKMLFPSGGPVNLALI